MTSVLLLSFLAFSIPAFNCSFQCISTSLHNYSMGWPTIPPSLVASDQVTIRRAGGWTQDASGGRVRNLSSPSSPVPCSFSPVGRVPRSHSANHRDMEIVKYLVTFANVNPKLHMNDELYWIAEDKTMVVVQTVTNGTSDSRLWGAFVEERPAV